MKWGWLKTVGKYAGKGAAKLVRAGIVLAVEHYGDEIRERLRPASDPPSESPRNLARPGTRRRPRPS